MSSAVMPIEERVGEYLNRFGDDVVAAGSGRWWVTRHGDGAARTLVAVDQDWLVVEQALGDCPLARVSDVERWAWRLLDAGLNLPSGARPVLSSEDELARMRAERSLPSRPSEREADDLWRWIESACADVAVGSVGALPTVVAAEAHDPPGHDEAIHADIPALCELAGWSASPRGVSDETLVTLPTRDGSVCHAIATVERAAARFRIALEVTSEGETTPACLAAVAVALLRVAGSVRLVRATLTHADASVAAALEVRVQPPLGPQTVDDALSSLAVAHQQIAAELAALAGDESLAKAYLALQGAR
jgi:hypothetical protein